MEYITISRALLTEQLQEISRLLLKLGMTPDLHGYWPCAYATLLVIQDPSRLVHVTKWLYPDVGDAFGVQGKTVERAVRTAVTTVWETNSAMLNELAGYELTEKPSVAKFLGILSLHFISMIVSEHADETVKLPAGPGVFFNTLPEHYSHGW